MSDTPETDYIETNLGTAAQCHAAIWMHARQMERERDKARNQRDAWEKLAILNAEKLGALLFGKAEASK